MIQKLNQVMHCPRCQTEQWPRAYYRGSAWTTFALCLVFFPAALVYEIWRRVTKKYVCPTCGRAGMISTFAAHTSVGVGGNGDGSNTESMRAGLQPGLTDVGVPPAAGAPHSEENEGAEIPSIDAAVVPSASSPAPRDTISTVDLTAGGAEAGFELNVREERLGLSGTDGLKFTAGNDDNAVTHLAEAAPTAQAADVPPELSELSPHGGFASNAPPTVSAGTAHDGSGSDGNETPAVPGIPASGESDRITTAGDGGSRQDPNAVIGGEAVEAKASADHATFSNTPITSTPSKDPLPTAGAPEITAFGFGGNPD